MDKNHQKPLKNHRDHGIIRTILRVEIPKTGPRCLVQVAGHASADFVVFAEAQGTGDQARGTFRQ